MKKLLIAALALMGVSAMAQEKVKVHNGAESYVTTIEYVTFDATAADEVVSVDDLQSQIAKLTEENDRLKYYLSETTDLHKYVDLGLTSGTLWATMNVGASSPEEYGDYFAMGEAMPKSSYSWNTYFDTEDGGKTFKKYNTQSGKTALDDADDIAVQAWGGKWKMPTSLQMKELIGECYWVWTNSYNGKSVKGYIVYKAKKSDDKGVKIMSGGTASSDYKVASDSHIFLPAGGSYGSSGLYKVGESGYYWSRSQTNNDATRGVDLNFHSSLTELSSYYRYNGLQVRPVINK